MAELDLVYKVELDQKKESYSFTWRSVVIGSLLGVIVTASNTYIGLKYGSSFAASMFGAILGFMVMKPLVRVLPPWLGGGGEFSITENCSLQSAAVAVGSLSVGFQSGIPALYFLNLLPDIDDAIGILFLWTAAAAFHGMFFGIPLRKYFIIQRKLVFPTPTAVAETIRTLHSNENAASLNQGKWIFWGFGIMLVWKVVAYFVPMLWDYHILYWIGVLISSNRLKVGDVLWGWRLQSSGALIGSGILMGQRAATSFLLGSIMAYGLIGPILVDYTDIVSHTKVAGFSGSGNPTVQFWCIWPGVAIIIVASLTELLSNYRVFYDSFYEFSITVFNYISRRNVMIEDSEELDTVPAHLRIPGFIWGPGLLCTSIISCLVMHFGFGVSVAATITGLFLGFLLAFVGAQSAGDVDINPMGAIGQASQFIFSGFSYPTQAMALRANILVGLSTMSTAAQTVDMVSDLKTGHLLGASPRSQFQAQLFGSVAGMFSAVGMFLVFVKAYPCILDMEQLDSCIFKVPVGVAWASVAQAMINGTSAIPPSSIHTTLGLAILTFLVTALRIRNVWWASYLPSMNAFGLGFLIPQPCVSIACFFGAISSGLWRKYYPTSHQIGSVGLASGFLAGEGIGGVVHAVFNLLSIYQDDVATGWGCPNNSVADCSN